MKIANHGFASNAILARRRILTGAAISLGAFAARNTFAQAQQSTMQQKPSSAASAARTTLHYEIDYAATPQRIYTALLDSKQFAAFSGMPAEIDAKPGGTFKMFHAMIEGRNVELVDNQRIVQAWRPASWAPGVYSIAHFELKAQGGGCKLVFDHTGFAAGLADHLDSGWQEHYWEPLKKFLV
jgi:activator of HSP90 ATPase